MQAPARAVNGGQSCGACARLYSNLEFLSLSKKRKKEERRTTCRNNNLSAAGCARQDSPEISRPCASRPPIGLASSLDDLSRPKVDDTTKRRRRRRRFLSSLFGWGAAGPVPTAVGKAAGQSSTKSRNTRLDGACPSPPRDIKEKKKTWLSLSHPLGRSLCAEGFCPALSFVPSLRREIKCIKKKKKIAASDLPPQREASANRKHSGKKGKKKK